MPAEELAVESTAAPLVEGWQGAGSMADTRKYHAGVVLPSGKVLVMGGAKGDVTLSSATVYDPGTGSWAPAAAMPEARESHTATVLSSGKVLVSGGQKRGTGSLATAAVYDPASNTWASAGSFASGVARHFLTATVLPSGKVLVVGGGSTAGPQKTVDVYDPVTGAWSQGPTLGTARRNHTATRLSSGKVLVVGGVGNSSLATAEVYDPQSNTWTPTGGLTTARYDHTATLLPSGKVLVVGGRNSSGGVLGTAEEYDPGTGTWSAAGALASARELHTATLLATGKVLVAGGLNGTSLKSAEVYDPATRQWSATASMSAARHVHVAVALESLGKVLVVGGLATTSPTTTTGVATAEAYVYSDACSSVSCNSPPGPCYQAAGTCSNGVCSYALKAAGSACNDGNACTTGDTCNGAGVCGGSAITCNSPPGQCYQSAGTCNNGSCSYVYKGAGTYCNDGNDETINDVCNGVGGCAGQYQCNPSNYYCPPPSPTYGPWSACSFVNACTVTGTQSRTVTPYGNSYSCFYAQCLVYQQPSYTETQTCSRPPPTLQCPGPVYGAWSACTNTNSCGQGGTQSRTVTTYTADYFGCECVPSTHTETQPCTGAPAEGYTYCNGVCTNIYSDGNNCGSCGHRCITPKFACSDGMCEQQY
jgi:hypothetical protein